MIANVGVKQWMIQKVNGQVETLNNAPNKPFPTLCWVIWGFSFQGRHRSNRPVTACSFDRLFNIVTGNFANHTTGKASCVKTRKFDQHADCIDIYCWLPPSCKLIMNTEVKPQPVGRSNFLLAKEHFGVVVPGVSWNWRRQTEHNNKVETRKQRPIKLKGWYPAVLDDNRKHPEQCCVTFP